MIQKEFRFDPSTYLSDEKLVAALKRIKNEKIGDGEPTELQNFIKDRYGTIRKPKRGLETDSIFGLDLVPSNKRQMVTFQPSTDPVKPRAQPEKSVSPGRPASAAGYKAMFETGKPEKADHMEEDGKKRATPDERALHKACWYADVSAVTELLQDVSPTALLPPYKVTPLHQVVFGCWPANQDHSMLIAAKLLAKEAELRNDGGLSEFGPLINMKDTMGRTALYHAAIRQELPMMNLLISNGADPNVAARDGSMPLHVAAEAGSLPAVELLLERGANEKDAEGKIPLCGSALHWAARAGMLAVVEALVEAGKVGGDRWTSSHCLVDADNMMCFRCGLHAYIPTNPRSTRGFKLSVTSV